ncbi:MAG: AAA family ATPase [Candidatus Altiarchaeota archaeon]
MRINRIDTKAYAISGEAEESAIDYFKEKAAKFEKESKSEASITLEYHYSPLAVFSAVKYDKEGKGIVIRGMENEFHVGLDDACFYVFSSKGYGEATKSIFIKSNEASIEKIDFLLKLASLSPKALQTLGYLLDQGTINFDKLDMPSQTAAKELAGRKYADIYKPVDREGDLTVVFREIIEFQPVTPVYKVKAMVPIPRFTNTIYNLSSRLELTDVVEDKVELGRITQSPDKIKYLLGTLFNCGLHLKRVVYVPYLECTFKWGGKQSKEIRHIPCLKKSKTKNYQKPKKLKTLLIGVKGYGLDSIPFEDVEIKFSNVAGMAEVKERIREGIIYPIIHPELSKEFGSKGGGGVLLYGPPGCGKTYIMRATVGEAGVNFYTIGVQEIVGDDMEASAKRLDESFNEARQGAPSILFFDEIDALGGSRKPGQSGAEHRLVNQFLTNMEGVGASNENVLIVGSTNAPWDMDPALRRAGRFTLQIFIPPPDAEARLALFEVHTKDRPLAKDVKFNRLVELTENYSSADITALCDEAAKIPWRASVHGEDRREISMADFILALNETESSLIPWLRLAEKQLRESGESDLFPELADYVFKRAGGIEMVTQPTMKFSDVAGLDDVKEEIKNKIVYPLKNPEMSKKYGRKPGGGVLLYGPPGCGKTYIAKATAGECEASFFNVKATDLLSPEEGVTEKRLHSIFERASRNTPAIIFFDEIDAIAGHRRSSGGAERRLINQFLTEMDGFEKKEGVVVLAATNAPWDIDPALRRAGRFSDQIFLPPPDGKSREEVFRIHAQGRPLSEDVNFSELSSLTDGYSSADIALICDEASKIPWREGMESGTARNVSNADFKVVISEHKPSITPWLKQAEKQLRESGESELYTELAEYVFKRAGGLEAASKPKMNFSDVGGLVEVKEEIKNKIVYPLKNPELAKEYGRTIAGGILFYGPPGCGKTYVARATAGECEATFYNVTITDLLSPEEGVTEKKLHSIFERASRNTPAVVFFDEIDAIAGLRSSAKGGAERRLINQFLTEMDGFEKKEGVVVLAATNAPWDIDPALRRAGRFSDQIFLPPPDGKSREEIFRIHTKNIPLGGDINIGELSLQTDGYSSSDIKLICDEAAKIPWKETMESGKKRPVTMANFTKVLTQRKSSITAWFKQAEKELKAADEETMYPELTAAIEKMRGA